MADSVWWPLVDGVLADNPDLQDVVLDGPGIATVVVENEDY